MLFREKNNDEIEIQLTYLEREIIYNALRHYSAYGKDDSYITDNIPCICEMMNVVVLPEFEKRGRNDK